MKKGLLTVCALIASVCAYALSSVEIPESYEKFASLEYKYTDKGEFPSSGPIITTVSSTLLTEDDTITVQRSAYKLHLKGIRHSLEVDRCLVQDFLYFQVRAEGVEDDFIPLDVDKVGSEEKAGVYNYTRSVAAKDYQISYEELNREFYKYTGTYISDIKGSKILLNFKFGVYAELTRKGESSSFKNYIGTKAGDDVYLYVCRPGKIAFKEEGMPLLKESQEGKVYALYPLANSNNSTAIQLISEESPSEFPDVNQQLVWSVSRDGSVVSEKKTIATRSSIENKSFGKSGMSFIYTDLNRGDTLRENDEYEVTRTINAQSGRVSCVTEPIKFQVVREAKIGGFSDTKIFVCPSKEGISFDRNSENYDNELKWLHIKGNKLNVEDLGYSSIYGIRYMWEYKNVNNANWVELPLNESGYAVESQYNSPDRFANLYNSAPQDLVIGLPLIKSGQEYEFRQVAYLENFDNRKITAIKDGIISVKAYDTITSASFDLSRMGVVCADKQLHEVYLKAKLKSTSSQAFKGTRDGAHSIFDYTSSFPLAGLNENVTSDSIVSQLTISADKPQVAYAVVTVKDGCGALAILNDSLVIDDIPVLNGESIVCSNAKKTVVDGVVEVEVPDGVISELSISREEANFSTSDYLYSENDSQYQVIGSRGLDINMAQSDSKRIYLKKRSRNGGKCESSALVVNYKKVASLRDNRIAETQYYVCLNESNPEIKCDPVSGGYGPGTYTYKWIYSSDSVTYKPMVEGENLITTASVSAGQWSQSINQKYYVRRIVISRSGDGFITDTSNYAVLTVYSTPQLTLNTDANTVCYDSLVRLSMVQDQVSLQQIAFSARQGHPVDLSYAYVTKNEVGEDVLVGLNDQSELNGGYDLRITQDTTLYARLSMCGAKVYSPAVKVKSGVNLTPRMAYGDCRVRGGKTTVSVVNPVAGWKYAIEQGGKKLGETTAVLDVPAVGSLNYQVRVSSGACEHVGSPTIDENTLHPAFKHFALEANQVKGHKIDVCAGEVYTIANSSTEGNVYATNYAWKVRGEPVENNDQNSLSYTFPLTGYLYRIERVSQEIQNGTLCQSICDTLYVNTYTRISQSALTLDNTGYVCPGDSVQWTVCCAQGGSWDAYNFDLYDGDQIISKGVIGTSRSKSDYLKFGTVGTHTLRAVITDNNCTDTTLYKQVTSPKSIIQSTGAAFTLSASPSLINTEDVNKGSTISITATAAEETTMDEFSWSYKKADGTAVTGKSVGGDFTVLVDSSSFTNDLLVINVTRRAFESGCAATQRVSVSQTQGFMQRPGISASLTQSEFCAGQSVTLSLPELPNFGEKKLTPSDVSYAWLRNGVLVSSAASYSPIAVAGDTVTIMCMISYKYDASLRPAQVYSEEYKLVGKPGIKLGKVTYSNTGLNTLSLCPNDTAGTFSLSVDAELSKNDTISWEESKDGNVWSLIPAVNRADEGILNGGTIELHKSKYSDDLSSTYFRVSGKSACGVLTYSTNIFIVKVDTIPSLPEVALRSNNMIKDNVVDSLVFSPTKNYAGYTFHWGVTEDDLNQKVTNNGAQAIINGDFTKGENSIYVYKTTMGGAQCSSPVLKYDFTLYEELRTDGLVPSHQDDTLRCPSVKSVKLNVLGVTGGTGKYSIVWQYKTYGSKWITFDEKSEELHFSVKFEEGNYLDSYQYCANISDLSITTSFRAIIGCVGDYKGNPKTTNEYTVKYYEPLTGGGIDMSEQTLCYGTQMPTLAGDLPSGGKGSYTYKWLKSSNPDEEDSWTVISNAAKQSFYNYDTMYASTFYKRIVTDECGSVLESKAKLVEVMPKYSIEAADVNYSKVVKSGSKAKMWGVPRNANDNSTYVWYDDAFQVLDTTLTSVIYSTTSSLSGGDYSKTYTFYAAKLDGASGCLSHNYDTLRVTAYDQLSGTIYVDGTEDANENNYWVCPGDKNVMVKSKSNPEGGEYRWSYRVVSDSKSGVPVVGDWSLLRGTASIPVRGEQLWLDTCDVDDLFKNSTGRSKYLELRRTSKITVANEEINAESNVIRVNIVPTMQSVNLLFDLVGKLSTERNHYCKGDEAVKVSGAVENESETMIVWESMSDIFGPWMYDPDYNSDLGFATWFEYRVAGGSFNTATVKHFNKDGYAVEFMPGEGMNHVMNATYNVRRAVSDGCTAAYTDILPLYVDDAVGRLGNVEVYAIDEDKRSRIYKGFEVGDSLKIGYLSSEAYECMWSLDSTFSDTLEPKLNYFSFSFSGVNANKLISDPHVYLKRLSDKCWSSPLAIPLSFGSTSNGGRIGSDQKVCSDAEFNMIGNISTAQGEWMSPVVAPMKWKYSWQFSVDSLTWAAISGADSTILDAVNVNKYARLLGSKTTYFRRMATNDSARVRYSNVVKMSYYDELTPGVLSLNTDKKGFCTYDELPTVTSSAATGGKTNEDGVQYSWRLSLNGGDYYEYIGNRGNFFNMQFDDSLMTMDRSENIRVGIKCAYRDGCGTVESIPTEITLNRENRKPNIYQDNDSCTAEEVTIKVIEDHIDKTYMFVAIMNTEQTMDSLIWFSEAKERTIRRNSSMVVDDYAVYSIDDETGCVSDFNYFNIDSMPALQQLAFTCPEVVCYGEAFTIVGQGAIGGNGSKTYAWQYSYDGLQWEDYLNKTAESLDVDSPVISTYYRRVVTDKCNVDTSASLLVKVREKVAVSAEDFVISDFKCPGQSINIRLADGLSSVAGVDYYSLRRGEEVIETFTGTTLAGFFEDSILLVLTRTVVDSMARVCESEPLHVYAHNAVAIDHDQNIVQCDNLTPCNGLSVDIVGASQSGSHSDRLKNKWYVSKDGINWTEQLLQTSSTLRLMVEDTMFVRRVLYNGCLYDTSNTMTIIGTKVLEYDYLNALDLSLVSDAETGSVTMNMVGSKNFAQEYYFVGDGQFPDIQSNSVLLPYDADTYRDSMLQLIAVSDECISQYNVTPLRGGIVSFDGDTLLCGGGDIPAIVSTDLEGGHGEYSYQWQYKNQYTSDFINIEGAVDRDYTPEAVSVATTYRRLTTSGEYLSVSNAITINIRPLPKTRSITIPVSDSALTQMGLRRTQYSVEKLPSMNLNLLDSISDVDEVLWQRSYDALLWENVETIDANSTGLYTIELDDTASVVYYRAIGLSGCGSDTTRAYKVTTLYASYITDEELVLLDSICKGDPYVRIGYKSDYSDIYEYSYRAIGFQGGDVYSQASARSVRPEDFGTAAYESAMITDTTRVSSGALFTYPEKSFDVEITRYVKTTGANSTKMVHFYVDDMQARFSYVIDGVETHMNGGAKHTVRLNQGSKVKFTPEVTSTVQGGALSYKWWLIEPLNMEYYNIYGGSEGREGLTSEKQSPSCYFNNPLDYTVKLMVSDGMCSVTAVDSAMYIDKSTFRRYSVNATFDEDYEPKFEYEGISIFPNPCVDFLYVALEKNERISLYDVRGNLLYEGEGSNVQIDMREFVSGTYLLNVRGESYVILK